MYGTGYAFPINFNKKGVCVTANTFFIFIVAAFPELVGNRLMIYIRQKAAKKTHLRILRIAWLISLGMVHMMGSHINFFRDHIYVKFLRDKTPEFISNVKASCVQYW
jgi:uncharacterized SAM-binding protein YcdF (DUF218 family)